MTLLVLVEDTEETLFEDRSSEGVGEHNCTVGRIRQRLHLQQSDLIETASEKINRMSVIGRAFGQALVELKRT